MRDDEVERRVEVLWADAAERAQVREALARYGAEPHEREPVRVRLAVLKLSEGRVADVLSMVANAKRDYRDVLMWAESPEQGRAVWASRPSLTPAERERLEEIRRADRQQYEAWLKGSAIKP